MMRRGLFSPGIVLAFGLFGRTALAQCTADVECKGDRICVDGACVSPPDKETTPSFAAPVERPMRPRTKFRSQPLFVGGIVTLALIPIALGVASYANFEKHRCEGDAKFGASPAAAPASCDGYDGAIYGGLIAVPLLAAAGVPMLLVGVQRVPVTSSPQALSILPSISRDGGGLALHATF